MVIDTYALVPAFHCNITPPQPQMKESAESERPAMLVKVVAPPPVNGPHVEDVFATIVPASPTAHAFPVVESTQTPRNKLLFPLLSGDQAEPS
jgi:hypothetical protein